MSNVNETLIVSIESITIDPEFRDVLSKKAQEEYTNLKEEIWVDGIRDSLIIGIIDEIHSVYQECTGKTSPSVKPPPKPRAKPKPKPANETPHVPPSTEGLVKPEQVEQLQTLAEQIDDIISALGNAIREDYASTDERINFLDRLIEWQVEQKTI